MKSQQRAFSAPPGGARDRLPSVVVIDDTPIVRDGHILRPGRGDFYRFAMLFVTNARKLTLCMPVRDVPSPWRRDRQATPLGSGIELAGTFPYTRVTEYVRRLPFALVRNIPVLRRAIRSADLVVIRLPAANGLLAFTMAALYRRPCVTFVVGYPAASRLTTGPRSRVRRLALAAAAHLDWASIAFIARRSLVFAYGSDLARRLDQSGARHVLVSFTSLQVAVYPRPRGSAAMRPRLLFAGRFAPEKGIDILLDAARRLADGGSHLHVDLVGDGPLTGSLSEGLVSSERLHVEFHGWVPDGPELDEFFLRADVFVQPSRSEGIPKVLLKAMAHGLPIIATNVGGIPDIVTDGVNGLLVPPDDAAQLAAGIARLLAERELAERLGRSALDFASRHTARRQVAEIWLEIKRTYPHLFPN